MEKKLEGDKLQLKPNELTGQSAVRHHLHHGHHKHHGQMKKSLMAEKEIKMDTKSKFEGEMGFDDSISSHEFSEFSGAKLGHIDIKSILIGVAVGALGFWFAKKHNLV